MDGDAQRLDRFLVNARFVKTRARAAALIAEGAVRVNRQPADKLHARLRPGDVITLRLGQSIRVLRVLALAPRRGPASEAQALYEEIQEERKNVLF